MCKIKFFEALLLQEHVPIETDAHGNILLDRNAQLFAIIVEWLLDSQALNKYKPFALEWLSKLWTEADFLQLDALMQYIAKHLQLIKLPIHQQLEYNYYETNASATGVMFDVKPETDIALEYFEICTSDNTLEPMVYYKANSIAMDFDFEAAWTCVQVVLSPVKDSSGYLRILFKASKIVLKEAQVYAFYIVYPQEQHGCVYYDYKHGTTPVVASNETLQLLPARALYFVPFSQQGEENIQYIGIIGYSLLQ